MPLSQADLLARLDASDFDALIDEFESEWLECKEMPYILEHDHQKLELAKDITALANASGGVLLVGYATQADPAHGTDRIVVCNPFPLAMFDEIQFREIVEAWTWPRFSGMTITVYTMPGRLTHAIVCIQVSECAREERPILVAKTIISNERADLLIGYCERKGGRVLHRDMARLHGMLRDGQRLDEELRDSFQALSTQLADIRERLPALPAAEANVPLVRNDDEGGRARILLPGRQATEVNVPVARAADDEGVQARILEALESAHLAAAPAFTLAAFPAVAVEIRGIFESRTSPLVRLLESPPTVRQAGFDLSVDGNSHIVRGALRRTVVVDQRVLEIHRDGLIVFAMRGDTDGLCWATRQGPTDANRINQLVLIETTFLFAQFAHLVFENRLAPDASVHLKLSLREISTPSRPCTLAPGPLDRWRGGSGRPAPESVKTFVLTAPFSTPPDAVAARLIAEVYNWFGFENDRIPYTGVDATHGRMVERAALVEAGRGR